MLNIYIMKKNLRLLMTAILMAVFGIVNASEATWYGYAFTPQMGQVGKIISLVSIRRIPIRSRKRLRRCLPFGPPLIWMDMCGLSLKQEAYARLLSMKRHRPLVLMKP